MKRPELHLPLTCAPTGVLWAICWGMVHRQSELDRTRVHLEESVPLSVAGLVCGAVIGLALQWAVMAWPVLARVFEVILIPVLVGTIAAPLGWLCRDAGLDWSGEPAILRAGAWGAGAGLVLYLATQVYRALNVRKAREPGTTADGAGRSGLQG